MSWRVHLMPSELISVLYRLLFLYLKATSHRDGHSYCSSQGCERVKIQAVTDSKDISNCMARAYPRYYRKPSALKPMPSMLQGLCQGCGTQQVKEEKNLSLSSLLFFPLSLPFSSPHSSSSPLSVLILIVSF